jgi:hypothetical protein
MLKRKTIIFAMYDYNFEERLTQKRLILLLLSIVIPTDKYILKNIYKKKREQEVEDLRYSQGVCTYRHLKLNRKICSQIRALYPGFIMYIIDSSNPVTDEVVHALPLTTCKDPKWSPYTPTPSGVSVINHVFQEPPLTFMEGAGIYDVGRQRLRGRLWPSYFNTEYRARCWGNGDYVPQNEILDKMQKEFREVSDVLEEKGDHEWYESIDELNEDKGIRVCKEIEY